MKIRYIYQGEIIGYGDMPVIPQEGQFIEFQAANKIWIITDVMFKTVLSGDVCVMIYISDITSEKEHKLRNYKSTYWGDFI